MGWTQIKRWLSFLPAAFIVYVLLHYLIYQPNIPEKPANFLGSLHLAKNSSISTGPQHSKEAITSGKLSDESIGKESFSLSTKDIAKDTNVAIIDRDEDSANEKASSTLPLQYPIVDTKDIIRDSLTPSTDYRNALANDLFLSGEKRGADALFGHSDSLNNLLRQSVQLKAYRQIRNKLGARFQPIDISVLEDGTVKEFLRNDLNAMTYHTGSSQNMHEDSGNLRGLLKHTEVDLINDSRTRENFKLANTDENKDTMDSLSRDRYNDIAVAIPRDSVTSSEVQKERMEGGSGNEEDVIIVPRELLSREDKESNKKKGEETSSSLFAASGNKSEELGQEPKGYKSEELGLQELKDESPKGQGLAVSDAAKTNSTPPAEEEAKGLKRMAEITNNDRISSPPSVVEINATLKVQQSPIPENRGRQVPSKVSDPKSSGEQSRPPPGDSKPPQDPQPAQGTRVSPPQVDQKATPRPVSNKRHYINFLRGKVTVGDKYEKGFSTPHEELCPNNGRDLKVLILITSAPDHEKHRNAVRQTWGHFALRRDIVIAFMLGRTSRTDVQTVIDKENDRYGDIIEANFVDHYVNLTLKTVSMFEWVKTYCSEARFFLKTDDDMFINVPLLLAFITAKKNERRAIFGRLAKGWKPVRNKKSKYYIDTATYSRSRYPDFLTGPAYLTTSDVVDDMYQKALNTSFFVLEDVLLTGIVGENLGIKRVGDSHFRNEKIKITDTCKLMQSISVHMVKYEEQFDIYKRTLDGKTKCKPR